MRYLLSRFARAVRQDEIEIHAYSVLPNHFHILARSPRGVVSVAMQTIQNAYVRHFNRGRRRDGSLFRGRFRSLPVESIEYRRLLVSYIDDNAVDAALAPSSDAYPWASTRHHLAGDGPPWLARSWIASELAASGSGYSARFPTRLDPEFRVWVERRIERRSDGPDEFDNLVHSSPDRIRAWMRRKAALADGTLPGQVLLPTNAAIAALSEWRSAWGDWAARWGRHRCDAWAIMTPGLLRDGCGLPQVGIAMRIGLSPSGVRLKLDQHRAALFHDSFYAKRTAVVLHDAVGRVISGKPVLHSGLARLLA